jgi:hypothetical protein
LLLTEILRPQWFKATTHEHIKGSLIAWCIVVDDYEATGEIIGEENKINTIVGVMLMDIRKWLAHQETTKSYAELSRKIRTYMDKPRKTAVSGRGCAFLPQPLQVVKPKQDPSPMDVDGLGAKGDKDGKGKKGDKEGKGDGKNGKKGDKDDKGKGKSEK